MHDKLIGCSPARDKAAIALALIFPTVVTLAYFVWTAHLDSRVQQVAYLLGKCLQFAFPLVWVYLVQKQPFEKSAPSLRGIAEGFIFGLGILTAMLALYHLYLKPQGHLDIAVASIQTKVTGMGIDSPLTYAGLAVFYALGHSLLEEYYWRWFVFAQLRRAGACGAAIIVSSLGFMAHHVIVLATFFGWSSFWTLFFSLAVAIGGAYWAWLYERHKSLYGPWLSHLVVDAGIFLIGFDLISDSLQ